MPAALSMGATKSGGRVTTSSGGSRFLVRLVAPVRAQRRASPPTTTTVPYSPAATAASAWLMTSCCETPTSKRSVRARGDPMRRATVRAGSVSDHEPWGTATQSTAPSRPGAPASAGGGAHRLGHEVGDGRSVARGAEPDQDGQARVEGAGGSGHDGRCYGPAMATGDEGRWQAALEGFTKESFEADGKRRDVYRIGDGPRGDRDQRDPGHHAAGGRVRPPRGGGGVHRRAAEPVRRAGPPGVGGVRPPVDRARLRLARVLRLRPEEDQPRHGVAAQAGRRRARALRRAGRRRGRHVLHRRLRAGHDGRRRRARPRPQPAVAARSRSPRSSRRTSGSPTRTWPG